MDEKQFSIISSKMDAIIKLLAIDTVKGKALREQVSILASFDFQPKQIADILGKTPNHIYVILHGLRKEEKKQGEEQQLEKQTSLMEEDSNDNHH